MSDPSTNPNAQALAALTGDAIFDLQHLALIGVDGDDAVDFLQGQLTNELREVTDTHAQQSAWCSPKGRVLTCFLVFRHRGRLLLQLPAALIEQTVKRMGMYVLRAKATLVDASDELMRMGLVGEAAEECLRNTVGALPEHADDVLGTDRLTIIRLRGRRPRYEIVGPRAALAALWEACGKVAVAADADAWELLDIVAGVASIGPDTSDAFVPQMINLDRIGGISFTKGCYVGQEIVARTQHLGRIKRRMYRAHWNGSAHLNPGETLHGAGEANSPKARIVNAKRMPEGGFALLAVIPIDVATELRDTGLTIADGSQLKLEALPYALEDENA